MHEALKQLSKANCQSREDQLSLRELCRTEFGRLLPAGFFSQFGDVKRLKVSRSKKTAKSKHYAFVEFQSAQVAAIAAEAMNGYMMFTQKLDCHVLPPSQVHPDLFKGASRAFKKIPWGDIEQKRHNMPRNAAQQVCRPCNAEIHCPLLNSELKSIQHIGLIDVAD